MDRRTRSRSPVVPPVVVPAVETANDEAANHAQHSAALDSAIFEAAVAEVELWAEVAHSGVHLHFEHHRDIFIRYCAGQT